ncbi:MAG: chorismate mutase [Desulfovibrionaceae bacterium]
MTTKSGRPGPAPDIREKRLGQLAELDGQILELLGKRAALLAREAEWRRSRGKAGNDPALEKDLFNVWTETGRRLGLDRQLLRQLFNLTGLFVPSRARTDAPGTGAYGLAPRREPLALSLPGPRSLAATRAWVVLAAAANRDLALAPIILNDPLVDLVRALNQVGARLSWAEELVEHQSADAPGLDFEGKVVFTGNDPFNLCVLVALALGDAGRVKLTGGPALKLLDTALFNVVLPRLGARIVPLNPRSSGLPARLEFGGEMAAEVELPAPMPPYFAAALALAAWSYPQGLHIRFTDSFEMRAALAPVVRVLNTAGVEARLEPGLCAVPHGSPHVPPGVDVPLDPVLSAYLLALPAFADGRCELTGRLDPDDPTAAFVLERLGALGLDLRRTETDVTTQALKLPEGDIILGRVPELFPLALAFALRARRPMTVQTPEDGAMDDLGEELLARLGADFSLEPGAFQVRPGALSWDAPWTCPTPHFALGLALAAFVKPGLSLENPGVLTALWPQFFAIYNGLPTGKPRPKPAVEKADAPAKRRVRL